MALVLFLGGSSTASAGVFDPARQWQTLVTPHFAIHHTQDAEGVARRVGGYAEEAFTTLTARLDNRPWGRIQVVLVDQQGVANGFATVLPYNFIVLRLASPDPDSSLANYDDWLKTLVTHELTHIVHMTTVGYPAKALKLLFGKLVAPNGLEPAWITEGLATYEETALTTQGRGRSTITEMILRTDVLRNRFLPLDRAAGTYPGWPSWRAAYLYGVEFMEFLASQYGERSLVRFSHSYGSTLWLYSLNHHAKKVFGKSFKVLWREWEGELKKRFEKEREELEARGLVEPNPLINGARDLVGAPLPAARGHDLYYAVDSVHRAPEIRVFHHETATSETLLKGYGPTQLSLDREGNRLAFSATRVSKRYYSFPDLFLYDLKGRSLKRLTRGERVTDPDLSPDGKRIAFVKIEGGTTNLGSRAVEDGETRLLTAYRDFEVVSHPRWSPDGRWIAAAVWRTGEGRDLYLFDPTAVRKPRRLTLDRRQLLHPWWSPDGRSIYVSSDRTGPSTLRPLDSARGSGQAGLRTGIFNIWKVDVANGRMTQVTNVLTGVFQPTLSADGRILYMRYYHGEGYDVRVLDLKESLPSLACPERSRRDGRGQGGGWSLPYSPKAIIGHPLPNPLPSRERESTVKAGASGAGARVLSTSGRREVSPPEPLISSKRAEASEAAAAFPGTALKAAAVREGETRAPTPEIFVIKPYRPGATLLPRFVQPMGFFLDNTVMLLASVGSQDPLGRHSWTASGSFRSDNQYFGGVAGYAYARFVPTLYLGAMRYAVNFGQRFILGENFFEERHRGYGGVTVPIWRWALNTSYFYEDRRVLSGVQSALIGTALGPPVGRYSGVAFTLSRNTKREFGASISPERGYSTRINLELTDTLTGADEDLEQRIAWTDNRFFVPLPITHHVLAFRLAGGAAFGDRLLQGNFGLGGSLGEGLLAGTPSRMFPFRGLPFGSFSKDRAFLASGEYRLPLFRADRGIGTLPLFLNAGHMALFTDVGNAWSFEPTFADIVDNTLLSVGLELRGDFTLSYAIPMTGRVGYGIVVAARDRIKTLNDDLTGAEAKYGTVVLQLGTSF